MKATVLIALAALALAGCMTSYPLWDPNAQPAPAEESSQPVAVTLQGRVESVDTDDESFELEVPGEDSDEWLRVELGSGAVVYPVGARDRSVEGVEGLEMLEEDDRVVVSGMKTDDGIVRAKEIAIEGRGESPRAEAPPAAPQFQPRDRVGGIVRAIDAPAGRIVLETDAYGLVAFYGDSDTPVFYKGVIYQPSSLEIGDDVTVTIGSTDDGDPATPWITAIDVNRSVSHEGALPPPAAAVAPPEPPKPNVQLEAIEIDGIVKRLEGQGFEIEAESGALRYVTADLLMPVACATVERVSDIELGMKIRVRALEVGNRLIAQKITLLE